MEIAQLTTSRPAASRAVPRAEEVAALQVRRGSLTEVERVEIESHVVHTITSCRNPVGPALAASRASPARTTST